MALMDELDSTGGARGERTEDYRQRTPAAVNMMLAELREMTGERGEWLPVEGIDDVLPCVGSAYARGTMAYGLAAALTVDENPSSAAFFHERYEELRNLHLARLPARAECIRDMYGGVEYGQFARW